MGKVAMPTPDEALRGRTGRMPVPPKHLATGAPLVPPFPSDFEVAVFGLGCFWGAERMFWQTSGVYTTAAGYAGGVTPNPTYEEVCSGLTGHLEVVLIVFDPATVSYGDLLKMFWESHDPTQGMRQGNDVGTQYRSAIFYSDDDQRQQAIASRDAYQQALGTTGHGAITTEIRQAPEFYYAEPEHQQYLERYPWGYCGLHGTGVGCPTTERKAPRTTPAADVPSPEKTEAVQQKIDEASRQSFPASDASSLTCVTGVRLTERLKNR